MRGKSSTKEYTMSLGMKIKRGARYISNKSREVKTGGVPLRRLECVAWGCL